MKPLLNALLFLTLPLACYGMEQKPFNLDMLPKDCVIYIAKYVIDYKIAQLKEKNFIIDPHKAPLIINEIKSLLFTSKNLHEIINDYETTSAILAHLQKHFDFHGQIKLNAAVELNTPGARQWIAINILPQEYPLFKTVQTINTIVDEMIAEFEQLGYCNINHNKLCPDGPQYTHEQTSGIVVTLNNLMRIPTQLHTPWGTLTFIFGFGTPRPCGNDAFCQAFLKRFFATLIILSGLTELFEQTQDDLKKALDNNELLEFNNIYRPISHLEAFNKIGTHTVITADVSGGNSYYQICKVGEQELPKVHSIASINMRTHKAAQYTWDALQAKYDQEQLADTMQ